MAKTKQNNSGRPSGSKTPLPSKKTSADDSNRLKWLIAILLVTFVMLSPTLKSEFINYDDDVYVTENPLVQNPDAGRLFSEFYMNQYAPLATGIMALEFKFNSDVVFIKTISLLLHLLVAFLLYLLLSSLFDRSEYILIPVALFALHPMQVESVAWTAASVKIGPYALFFISSLLFYVKYLEKKQIGYFFISLLLFLCSCFSKEQAIVLSVTLLAIDYFKGRSFADKKLWLEKIPFLALTILFGIITLKASSSSGGSFSTVLTYSMVDRLLISNYSVFAYIAQLVVPMGLSAFVTYPLPKEINALYYLAVLGFPVLIYALYTAIKKDNKLIVFGISFFLINIGLSILSQLLGARDVMMADRYVYLPSIGIFILLTASLIYLKENFSLSPNLLYGTCIVYALTLGVSAYGRATVWHDSISVFSDVIEKGNNNGKYSPFLSLPFNNRGIALKQKGNLDAAFQDYKTAMEINPGDPKAYANRGNIYFERQKPAEAIKEYNKSLAIDPNQAIALSSRGAAYGMQGKLDSAIRDFTRSIALDPISRNTYMNRSLAYFNSGKHKEALDDLNKHMQVNPGDVSSYGQRGLIYMNMGDMNKALEDINKAISLQPGVGAHYLNRSLTYRSLGNKNAAIQDALKAKELGQQVSEEYLR